MGSAQVGPRGRPAGIGISAVKLPIRATTRAPAGKAGDRARSLRAPLGGWTPTAHVGEPCGRSGWLAMSLADDGAGSATAGASTASITSRAGYTSTGQRPDVRQSILGIEQSSLQTARARGEFSHVSPERASCWRFRSRQRAARSTFVPSALLDARGRSPGRSAQRSAVVRPARWLS